MGIKIQYRYYKAYFIYIVLPILPLIEGLFFNPIGNFKVEGNTYPFMQGLFLVYLLISKKLRLNNITSILLILIFLNIFVFVPFPENTAYFIIFFLAYLLVKDVDNYTNYKKLKVFIISYSVISILIYFFRLYEYSFDLIRTRSGSNIYGANELTGILLILLSYSFYSKKIEIKDSILFFLFFLFFGILFIRRITLVTSSLILILFIFFKFSYFFTSKKGLKMMVITTFNTLIIYIIIIKFNFISSILFRFLSAEKTFNSFSGFFENTSQLRLELWKDGIDLFKTNPIFGIGAGNFKYHSFQSTAHSLFINNLAEFGFFLGSILNIIYLLPLFKILKTKLNFSNKTISFISYLFFLILANISGVNLFQNTGYISAFSTMGFFFIIKFSFQKKNDLS